MKELVERMIAYRAENDLSQKELARLCNLSLVTIRYVENGTKNVTKLTKAKIERIIDNK